MKNLKLNKTTMGMVSALAMLPMAGSAANTIVYQDTFDDGDLALNSGIGGGFSENIAGGGVGYTETSGSIVGDSSANNQRAYGYSTNSFDLSGGFILNFIVNSTNTGSASANRFSVGLAEAGSDFAGFATTGRNFLGSNLFIHEGIGVNFTTDDGQGLRYNDGLGSVSTVSAGQTITANTELDVTLTVDSSGAYTYSINGATASAGTTILDLSNEYHVATYYQDNEGTSSIREVTLTAVPEPSSTALLGLGGLALILRRRK